MPALSAEQLLTASNAEIKRAWGLIACPQGTLNQWQSNARVSCARLAAVAEDLFRCDSALAHQRGRELANMVASLVDCEAQLLDRVAPQVGIEAVTGAAQLRAHAAKVRAALAAAK